MKIYRFFSETRGHCEIFFWKKLLYVTNLVIFLYLKQKTKEEGTYVHVQVHTITTQY
jgi:hypothetical protein